MELVIYFNYLFQNNKGDNRMNKMTKQSNMNYNTKKNHYCSQIKKKKKLLNLEEDDSKYKRKIINYNSVKDERTSSNDEKNNFLFYINNKNENIINIDNIMNFRFNKGINNLKTKNINIHKTEEIKSYVDNLRIHGKEIEEKLADASIYANAEECKKITREHHKLEKLFSDFDSWVRALEDLESNHEMLASETDAELRSLI
jgi:hypothetical protein